MITERPRTHYFLWVELQTGLDATIGSNVGHRATAQGSRCDVQRSQHWWNLVEN
jgi:hypothetical protein